MSKQTVLKQIEALLADTQEAIPFKQEIELPFEIGKAYFIRTVTYFATGRVKDIVGQFLVLDEAAWIADTGRFSDAMAKGVMSEVEPIEGEMILNTSSITDAFSWGHKLPRDQK
jgi:hypothetical protein